MITIAGAAWKLFDRKNKSDKQLPQSKKPPRRQKLPPVEIPEWIEKEFPTLAGTMRSYPDYCIEDKKMYEEYLRMNQEAINADYYREYNKKGETNSKEVDQKLKTLNPEIASALNFAKAQLLKRTCFQK